MLGVTTCALSLCGVFVGLLLSMSVNAATTLKIATLSPEGTGWMIELRAAAKAIRQRTDDEVKLKIYPGGVMGDDKGRAAQAAGWPTARRGHDLWRRNAALPRHCAV
jgi:TRAP-type C4-dicarboxylate transport system substrate-binding protein